MRTRFQTAILRPLAQAPRRILLPLVEVLLYGGLIAVLELIGPQIPTDAFDLVVLTGLCLLGYIAAVAARAGWLPVLMASFDGLRRLASQHTWLPRHVLAFRRNEEAVPRKDPVLRPTVAVLVVMCAGVLLAGERLLDGLTWLKHSFSYTLYLGALLTIWAFLFGTVLAAAMTSAQWLAQARHRGVRGARTMFLTSWILGLVSLLFVPGAALVFAIFVLGAWRLHALERRPLASYLFCRRDVRGRPLAISVDLMLRRTYLAVVLLLAFVVGLGQAGRLFVARAPSAPFAFMGSLGIIASLAAIFLVLRIAAHIGEITGGPHPPELPFIPTLWCPEGAPKDARILHAARAEGFDRFMGREEPPRGYDLVLDRPDDPRRLVPRPDASIEDLRFQIRRRLHVVRRRRFWKPFHSQFKHVLAALEKRTGGGFMLCPHAWMIGAIVRNVDPVNSATGAPSISAPHFIGPMFRDVFEDRTRQYIGMVLRALEVDVIFWEERVGWQDLKRVLGICFEMYDQGRTPLQPIHFVGVPRVRVMIMQEEAEPEPPEDEMLRQTAPAAGFSRVLLIMRDEGGMEAPARPTPDGRRKPAPVGSA